MYTVYVLQNSQGKLYTGQTVDFERRLVEHNFEGKGYTAKYRPWTLIWSKKFSTRSEAMKEERFLKTGVGREWLKNNIMGG